MAVMMINTEKIKALNPCKDRFDNYLNHYADFDGDLKDFISLENISYSDKVWVFTRLATKRQNVVWAILCASKVLSIFEEKYPDDKRPRLALEAVENWINNPCEETASAARSAARSAESAAWSAASAAWSAARSAERSAEYAARSAAWSASAESAASAASAATRSTEEEVNLILMVEAASWL